MINYPSAADIAEMKARGYDPSTLESLEEDRKRGERAEVLCRQIEGAFAGVTLGLGVGLMEGQGLDDYEDEKTRAMYREQDEKDDWQRIPVENLNRCRSSLSFFDCFGMRFHLPAFMIADLRRESLSGVEFFLYHKPWGGQFALLSEAQRTVVRAFLVHIAEDPGSSYERADILKALDGYWASTIPEKPIILRSPSSTVQPSVPEG